jgi:hypothetical protein
MALEINRLGRDTEADPRDTRALLEPGGGFRQEAADISGGLTTAATRRFQVAGRGPASLAGCL